MHRRQARVTRAEVTRVRARADVRVVYRGESEKGGGHTGAAREPGRGAKEKLGMGSS